MSRQVNTRKRAGRTFTLHGKPLRYAHNAYNGTWNNERSIEIPIFQAAIAPYQPEQILEVGTVLRNYMTINHTVIDKYEEAPNVLNVDVIDYQPGRIFDLIISISTLEHVGWDETPKEPAKVRRAIDHLRQLLSPTGKLMFSVPIGHNDELNRILANGEYPWESVAFLQRVSHDNVWREVPRDAVLPPGGTPAAYDRSVPSATAIAVCTIGPAV